MANSINIQIKTKVDDKEYVDLKKKLEEDKDYQLQIGAEVDDKEIKSTKKEIEDISDEKPVIDMRVDGNNITYWTRQTKNLDGTEVWVKCDVDGTPLKNAEKQIRDMNGKIINIDADVDDSQLKSTQTEVNDLNGEIVGINLDVDDSQLKTAQVEVNDMDGKHISVNLDVDTSQLSAAKKEVEDLGASASTSMGSTANAVNGAISMMAGKNIWDTIYGTSKRNETNQILLKNMADTTVGVKTLYNTVDKTTDASLISMQQLIPAINGIKSATGASASTINNITPGVAQFGQYVYALTGSASKAETAMFDLSKGIKGAFASLDQYGITEDALKRTGLWNGKEDDVEGYIKAVNQVTGSTDELMDSTTGLEALIGKAFSRGGKRLGEYVLPAMQGILRGFLGLDSATNGWLSTALLAGGQIVTTFTSVMSVVGQVGTGIRSVKDGWNTVKGAFGDDGSITKAFSSIKSGASSAVNYIKSIGNNLSSIGSSAAGKLSGLKTSLSSIASSAKNASVHLASSLWKALKSVASIAKTAAVELAKFTVNLIKSGAEAVIAAGKWIIAKGALLAEKTATMLAAGAQAFLNFVMSMNPIILVITAIIALIAILTYLYFTNEDVRNAIDGLGQALVGVWNWIVSSVSNAVNSIIAFAQGLYTSLMGVWNWITDGVNNTVGTVTSAITGAFTWIQDAFNGVITFFQTYGQLFVEIFFVMATGGIGAIFLLIGQMNGMPSTIGAILQSALTYVTSFASNFINRLVSAGTNAVNRFKSSISRLPGALRDELNEMISEATNFIGRIGQILYNAGVNAVKNFLNGLGRHSPGIIQTEMLAELKETATRIPESSHIMKRNIFNLAKDVVDSWGNPQFEYGFADNDFKLSNYSVSNNSNLTMLLNTIIALLQNLNGGNFVFNHYGDIDNEEKMERILEAIRRELSWNNQTAGRTV